MDAPPGRAPARPRGVTLACALAVALGVVGLVAGIGMAAWGALFFLALPILGAIGLAIAAAGIAVGAAGILLLVGGIVALRGVPWARIALAVLYILGALGAATVMVLGFADPPVALIALAGVALCAAGVWPLVEEGASRWFEAANAARVAARR